ncbi:MAG: hypothetical protein HDR21_13890 [Lachnospiraceae bacterium]|nr:hypothetical protein [Lachnospiraceae bacterium]
MKNGGTIGTMNYDGLIIDGKHDLDVKGATINLEAATTIARGTLLSIGSDGKAVVFTGKAAVAGSGGNAGTPAEEPDCILADELVAEDAGEFYVSAYKSGNFNRQALETVTGITLTDAHIETLRTKGIYVESVME